MKACARARLGLRHRIGLFCSVLLGLAILCRGGPDAVEPASPRRERPRATRAPVPIGSPSPSPSPALTALAPGRRGPPSNRSPRITRATLDRQHLCPGQSTFLRVDAEDPDDGDLRYRAIYHSATFGGPRFGFGRWLRFEAPEAPGTYGIVAVVEDPSRARDEVPLEVVVDDCDGPVPFEASELRMRHTELDAQVHEFDLDLALERARRSGPELEVVGWHFGDGTTHTASVHVRHRYPVVLDRRYSYYLVQAEVTVDGAPARIEYGLSFYSYAAANLHAGYVALAADVERGGDSADLIEYVVTFSNLTPFSAWAKEFELMCFDEAGVPRQKWREPLELTIPGETSLEQTLVLDRRRCPGGANYELFGEAEGGYAVGGLWSYKLRPSEPIRDHHAARERARLVLGASTTGDSE
jgi:hypothetical protein